MASSWYSHQLQTQAPDTQTSLRCTKPVYGTWQLIRHLMASLDQQDPCTCYLRRLDFLAKVDLYSLVRCHCNYTAGPDLNPSLHMNLAVAVVSTYLYYGVAQRCDHSNQATSKFTYYTAVKVLPEWALLWMLQPHLENYLSFHQVNMSRLCQTNLVQNTLFEYLSTLQLIVKSTKCSHVVKIIIHNKTQLSDCFRLFRLQAWFCINYAKEEP